MKRQSLVLLAVAFAAAGVAGCFKDPVSGLRSGPTIVNLDHTSIYVAVGDSTVVTATVSDNGGNVLPETDAVWTSGDPTVAVVRKDTTAVIPGDYFTRAFIRGVLSTGGITNVTIQTRGLTATVRVIVTPPQIPATQHSLSGGPSADTVIVPLQIGPPIIPPDTVAYTAGDTLTINGTAFLNFDTSKVAVYAAGVAGSFPGYVFAKTPTQLKVGFLTGASGRVWVKNLLMVTGNTSVGTQPLDSLVTVDSVLVARLRFRGSITQLGDTMTVQAGTGQTFTASTGVAFGASSAIILTQTASTMNVLSPATFSGQVCLTGVTFGTAVLANLCSPAAYTINGATFPTANVNLGGGNLGDTITVTAPTGLAFRTTGTAPSKVLVGNTAIATSDTAWILSRTATTITAFAKRGGGGRLSVTNLLLGASTVISKLTTPGAMPVDSVVSDFPGGTTLATARALTIPANDTAIAYGATPPSSLDFWTFTTSAAHVIKGSVAWFGSGNPYTTPINTSSTDDIDFLICNAATKCDESGADLSGFQAATTAQPESFTTASLPAAQYWLGVFDFNAAYSIVYKMTIILQ